MVAHHKPQANGATCREDGIERLLEANAAQHEHSLQDGGDEHANTPYPGCQQGQSSAVPGHKHEKCRCDGQHSNHLEDARSIVEFPVPLVDGEKEKSRDGRQRAIGMASLKSDGMVVSVLT